MIRSSSRSPCQLGSTNRKNSRIERTRNCTLRIWIFLHDGSITHSKTQLSRSITHSDNKALKMNHTQQQHSSQDQSHTVTTKLFRSITHSDEAALIQKITQRVAKSKGFSWSYQYDHGRSTKETKQLATHTLTKRHATSKIQLSKIKPMNSYRYEAARHTNAYQTSDNVQKQRIESEFQQSDLTRTKQLVAKAFSSSIASVK